MIHCGAYVAEEFIGSRKKASKLFFEEIVKCQVDR